MLSVEQALDLVLEAALPLPATDVLTEAALGRVLAQTVTAEMDSPPWDKSQVDGYALRAHCISGGTSEFNVLGVLTAGSQQQFQVEEATAVQIMTGAPIPPGASAVVMIEKTEPLDHGRRVRVLDRTLHSGQNILRQGQSVRSGQTLVGEGTLIRPIELGLLAESGRPSVKVISRPRVAVLATGDELVPFTQTPRGSQIRNTNGPMLAALIHDAGATPDDWGLAGDSADALEAALAPALAGDVVVLSGGVSAGIADYVPQVLTKLGVQQIFHHVNLKPGKPLWFGIRDVGTRRTLVFGLPGNPVSSLVCFELFVRPALKKLAGHKECVRRTVPAILTKDHQQRGERVTYWPSRLEESADGSRQVTPLAWQGSGDLGTLADANGLAIFPGGDRSFASGQPVNVLML